MVAVFSEVVSGVTRPPVPQHLLAYRIPSCVSGQRHGGLARLCLCVLSEAENRN